ncbi:hypothetical protein BGZ73_007361 [Actinomortierella ambigua]|nr:hypothetical protein BGZ73_007361 [Actinomortierella ambigua]
MSGFTNTHRLFLQAAISRRHMDEATAKDLYKRVCEATHGMSLFNEYDADNYDEFIDKLNEGLNSVEFEFRRAVDEVTGQPVISLTNTNGQKIAQVATSYNPTELEYFKHLLDAIVNADDDAFCIGSKAALIESSNLKNKDNKPLVLTKKEAEALLARFVADQWFLRSSAGAYSLSMRTLLELQTFLKETYPNQIQECTLCMDIITKGQRCQVSACAARLHHHCAQRYFQNRTNKTCPTCQSQWTGNMLIGIGDTDQAPSSVSTRRRRQTTARDQDGDVEGEAVEEYEGDGGDRAEAGPSNGSRRVKMEPGLVDDA